MPLISYSSSVFALKRSGRWLHWVAFMYLAACHIQLRLGVFLEDVLISYALPTLIQAASYRSLADYYFTLSEHCIFASHSLTVILLFETPKGPSFLTDVKLVRVI